MHEELFDLDWSLLVNDGGFSVENELDDDVDKLEELGDEE
jgi:hypothetical protein